MLEKYEGIDMSTSFNKVTGFLSSNSTKVSSTEVASTEIDLKDPELFTYHNAKSKMAFFSLADDHRDLQNYVADRYSRTENSDGLDFSSATDISQFDLR